MKNNSKSSLEIWDKNIADFQRIMKGNHFEKGTELYDEVSKYIQQIIDILEGDDDKQISRDFPKLNGEILSALLTDQLEEILDRFYSLELFVEHDSDNKELIDELGALISGFVTKYNSYSASNNSGVFNDIENIEFQMRLSGELLSGKTISREKINKYLNFLESLSKKKNYGEKDIPQLKSSSKNIMLLLNLLMNRGELNMNSPEVIEGFNYKRIIDNKVKELESSVYIGKSEFTKMRGKGVDFGDYNLVSVETNNAFSNYNSKTSQYSIARLIFQLKGSIDTYNLSGKTTESKTFPDNDILGAQQKQKNYSNLSLLRQSLESNPKDSDLQFSIDFIYAGSKGNDNFINNGLEIHSNQLHHIYDDRSSKSDLRSMVKNIISHGKWK